MREEQEIRRITEGDTIAVTTLRDFVLRMLRHDALYDVVLERMAFHAERDQLDAVGLAAVLPELIGDVLEVGTKEDWIAVAGILIEDFRDARGEGAAR